MANKGNIFQLWLGSQDDDIRQLVEREKLNGASVSEILKKLIRHGADKRDDKIVKMLNQQRDTLAEILARLPQ